jgi:hypothetical protein
MIRQIGRSSLAFLLPALILALGGNLGNSFAVFSKGGGPDNFGYMWDDSNSYVWQDASAGVDTGLEGDDSWSEAIPIGFSFPFYENTYTEVYLSTNGFLTFDVVNTDYPLYVNKPIPNTGLPNDYIAPFWEDLYVGGEQNAGRVFYQMAGEVGSRYLIVEWQNITWSGNFEPLLTFEAILYEDGNICFQYADLNGNLETAVIGIEDRDGVDGIQYLPDPPGIGALVQTNALCFVRPAPAARAKALPPYQSAFTVDRQSLFQVFVRNTGELGADVYDLSPLSNPPDWEISLFAADGFTPLTDTDEDGIVDVGVLGQGETTTVTLVTQAPAAAPVGAYATISLSVTSSLDENQGATVVMQSAAPAPFVQVFTDTDADSLEGLTRMYFSRIMPSTQSTRSVNGYFTGSTIGIAASSQKYLYFWERSGVNDLGSYSDIEYVLLNAFGNPMGAVQKLTDNSTALQNIRDQYPAAAIAPNGWIGVIWVRDIYGDVGGARKQNSNIFFAVLDPSGILRYGPIDLTNNQAWRGGGDLDVPVFQTPRIVATQDDHLILAWADDYTRQDGTSSDIFLAIYDTAGTILQSPTSFTQSVAGGMRYVHPTLAELESSRVLLAYSIYDPVQVVYAILNSSGVTLVEATAIAESNGQRIDAVQVTSGPIILAWTNVVENKIAYAVLDDDGVLLTSPQMLESPYARQGDYVSVTRDPAGHGILTWIDAEWNDVMFYALLDGSGNVVTPPIIFLEGQAGNPLILSSYAGRGNAPQLSGALYLPMVRR